MPDFDLVILGAGPAGTAAAMQARTLGLSVALVDKASFPRAKLCGGLVTGRCAGHLAGVFGVNVTSDLFETRDCIEFHLENQPLGVLHDVPPLYLTMRWDFDAMLLDHALRAGAANYTGHRIDRLDLDRDRVHLASGEALAYRVLIGADGVHSIVAKALFGQSFSPQKIGFALEIEGPPAPQSQPPPLRIDFAAARWGYGWSFPKKASTTIGLGGLHVRNADMKARLSGYLAKLGCDPNIKVKGHFLPFGEVKHRPGRGNVVLVGDAAGFVDPITGEGIGYAIQSGALAAEAAHRALRDGPGALSLQYYRAATPTVRSAVRYARWLRPLLFAPALQPFFAHAFQTSHGLRHEYMRLLAGQTEYPALLWRLARRLPAAGWRHFRAQPGPP